MGFRFPLAGRRQIDFAAAMHTLRKPGLRHIDPIQAIADRAMIAAVAERSATAAGRETPSEWAARIGRSPAAVIAARSPLSRARALADDAFRLTYDANPDLARLYRDDQLVWC